MTTILSEWPVPRPRLWLSHLQEPQTEAELAALRRSVTRDSPFGSPDWTEQIAKQLDLEITLRSRGRTRKQNNGS